MGTQSHNFNSNIVWRKLNLPEWLMKADLNCRMRGKQVNLLVWFTTWRGLRNRRTTRTNLWMKGRRQEAHIMAQEEGLSLNSFFEFQAIEMLNYLRMKSEKKLPTKEAMTAVQTNTSYRIHKSSHVRCYSCDAPLTNISWEGEKRGEGWGDGKSWGAPTSLKGDFIVIDLNEKRNKSNKRTAVGLAGKPVNQWVEQPKTKLPSWV